MTASERRPIHPDVDLPAVDALWDQWGREPDTEETVSQILDRNWRDSQADGAAPPAEPLQRITVEMLEVMAERIHAALADLDQVMPGFLAPETHAGECWQAHAGCLAARIRHTLTGEDHPQ